jgi:hypothetical protein
MYVRKICVLLEHIEKVEKYIGDTPFTLKFYKYHAEITLFSVKPYYIAWFNHLQIPVALKQENDTAHGEILYTHKLRLLITNKLSSVKTNWKLQHQRHQTAKLLQITG